MSELRRHAARRATILLLLLGCLAAPRRSARGGDGVEPLRVDSGARGARIEGRVVDEKGRAVASARVAAYRTADVLRTRGSYALGLVAPDPVPRGTAATDAQGRFAIPDLPSGMTVLIAEVPGGGRGAALATAVAVHPVAVRVRIEPVTTRIHGRVTDEHGLPLARASVVTLPGVLPVGIASILVLFTWSARTSTDERGRFDLGMAAGMTERVAAQRPGDGRWTVVDRTVSDTEGGPSPSVDIAFTAGPPLTAQVVGARMGRPVGGAHVVVVGQGQDGRFASLQALTADAAGRLSIPSFPSLREGGFAVLAAGIGGDWQDAAPTRDALLRVRRGATLSGHVRTADGRPVVGARVLAYVWDWPALEAATDDEGRYAIHGLPRTRPGYADPTHAANGLCQPSVDVPGYATDDEYVNLDVRPEQERLTQDFVLHAGATIRGRADASDAGRELHWTPGDPEPYGELAVVRATTIGEDGSFVLVDLPPGRVTLTFPGERRVVVTGLRAGETRVGVQGPPPK